MKFERLKLVGQAPSTGKSGGAGSWGPISPTQINKIRALRNGAVPPGRVLNPYGKLGNTFKARYRLGKRDSWRALSLERKRLKLKDQKAVALEAHELQQLARENATLAMQTLIEISKNTRAPEATRIAASSVILDRGYGKASQTSITASIGNGKTSDLTADELDKRVSKALGRVEELTKRTPQAGKSKKGSSHLH
jgi:hypothetical protein